MIRGLMHAGVAMLAAASLVVAPAFAQSAPTQTQSTAQTSNQPAVQPENMASVQEKKVTLGPDYSIPKHVFPTFLAPFTPRHIDEPMLTNTPRIDQLLQDGKLMLSLDDAVSIALEDNLDISVQRFTPWIAETQLLKARAGGVPQTGSTQQVVLGSSPSVSFDPVLTAGLNWGQITSPINNPFLSGVGSAATIAAVRAHSANYNFGITQGFHTGTNVSFTFDNTRSTSSTGEQLFNPAIQSTITLTVTQPLLNGFGRLPNTRYILEAKNSIQSANSAFSQQVISTVTAVANDYWELVYARENVKVEEAAVGVSQKLYNDNQKQLEIGTMAPLDVLTAESQLATDQQNLIVAQTVQLQDETNLLVAITKDPLAGNLTGIEIVPTTEISTPDVENISLADAVHEAWNKRPELFQASMNLKNAGIEVRASKNSLLPSLNLFGQYSQTGLAGNRITTTQTPNGTFVPDLIAPLVDGAGNQIDIGGAPVYAGTPQAFNTAVTVAPGGVPDAWNSMIHYNFPSYVAGLNLTLPIRNRSAQADNARTLLDQRQEEVQYQATKNTIVLGVRNALIALQQDRAQVAAAGKARDLAQQTLDDEQKKYQLGTSTSYNVVLRSRDLTAAEGTELRARVNLEEAKVNFNQAMGRTLEAHHIIVADALRGTVKHDPLIPGEPNWDATPGQK